MALKTVSFTPGYQSTWLERRTIRKVPISFIYELPHRWKAVEHTFGLGRESSSAGWTSGSIRNHHELKPDLSCR